jgi:hypothetical protein
MEAWYPSPAELDVALENTRLLRTSDADRWSEARSRLQEAGVSVENAVLADEVSAGRLSVSCLAVSRDERVFSFNVIFGLDRDGNPLPKGEGRVGKWREIPPERVRLTDSGIPNSYLRAVVLAHELFASS